MSLHLLAGLPAIAQPAALHVHARPTSPQAAPGLVLLRSPSLCSSVLSAANTRPALGCIPRRKRPPAHAACPNGHSLSLTWLRVQPAFAAQQSLTQAMTSLVISRQHTKLRVFGEARRDHNALCVHIMTPACQLDLSLGLHRLEQHAQHCARVHLSEGKQVASGSRPHPKTDLNIRCSVDLLLCLDS